MQGMGEPLHNLDAVLPALQILSHPQGLGLSPNKVRPSAHKSIVQSMTMCPRLSPARPACRLRHGMLRRAVTTPAHAQITVSTVGLVLQMRALVACSGAQLAVSLHATTDEVRDWLAPVNRRCAHLGLLRAPVGPADSLFACPDAAKHLPVAVGAAVLA